MHDVKPEIVDQISHADRNDNGLIGSNAAQSSPVEMIEMRVGDEDEIDLRQVVNFEAGLF